MKKLKCQVQNHYNQDIIVVCMDKSCKIKSKLCCLTCLTQLHSCHKNQWINIYGMNAFIHKELNKQSQDPLTLRYGQRQLIEGLKKLNILISNLYKIIKEKIQKLESQNLQNYLKETNNSYRQQGTDYWDHLFEGISQYVEIDNDQIRLKKSNEGQLSDIQDKQIKTIKQYGESLKSMINQMTSLTLKDDIPIQIETEKICFREDRQNIDLAIIDGNTIINKTQEQLLLFVAYANKGFDPSKQSYSFAFNIQKFNGWIAVGVGNDEGGNVPGYNITYFENLGHGQYLNSYGKQTYHHTDSQINDKQNNGLIYNDGDTIQIRYDHTTKVLEFRKQSEKDTVVRMPITDMTKILYPCVALYLNGGQVQLTAY